MAMTTADAMTTLSDHFDVAKGTAGAFFSSADADRVRLDFHAARRHSAHVRLLQFVLPTLAVCALAVFALMIRTPSSDSRGGGDKESPIPASVLSGVGLTVSYKGFTDDGGAYFVTAAKARPELLAPSRVHLDDVDGTLTQKDGRRTRLKAPKGLFDNDKGRLELFGGIDIVSSDGTKARLTRATVFVKEQRIVSKEPVYAESLNGTIRARTMVILQKQQEIVFDGSVKVRILKKATLKGSGKQSGLVAK